MESKWYWLGSVFYQALAVRYTYPSVFISYLHLLSNPPFATTTKASKPSVSVPLGLLFNLFSLQLPGLLGAKLVFSLHKRFIRVKIL